MRYTYKHNNELRSRNHRFCVTALIIILCLSVAFVTQHVTRMRRSISSSVAFPTPPNFFHFVF